MGFAATIIWRSWTAWVATLWLVLATTTSQHGVLAASLPSSWLFGLSAATTTTLWRPPSVSRTISLQPLEESSLAVVVSESTIDRLLSLTNAHRRDHGLVTLLYNPQLAQVAEQHASDMARNAYFSHSGRNGSTLKDRVVQQKSYRFKTVGENLYWRSPDPNPDEAVQSWMRSPGHRANLLNPDFTEIGLGVAVQEDRHYYVQVFGTPLETPSVQGEDKTRDCLFGLTNRARSHAQLRPFEWCDQLDRLAQQQAQTMARRGSLGSQSDRSLVGKSLGYSTVAMNAGFRGPFNDPYDMIDSWLREGSGSYTLSSDFTDLGVGYATSSDGEGHYYVQLFGSAGQSSGLQPQQQQQQQEEQWKKTFWFQ